MFMKENIDFKHIETIPGKNTVHLHKTIQQIHPL